MKATYSKLSAGVALLIAWCFMIMPVHAMAPDCHSDQRQLQSQAGVGFGGKNVVAQTFVLSEAGLRVCKVKVTIRKNVANAGAVTLRLLNAGFAPMSDPVTIAGAGIPMGISTQVFELGCDHAALGAGRFAIQLESRDSPPAAYSWRGAGGNPYVQPANGGRGWSKVGGGNWNNLGLWDFAFDIYVC